MASRFFGYDPYDYYYTAAPYNYPYDPYYQRQPAHTHRSNDGATLGAGWGGRPSYRRRSSRAPE
jgi:hypothetical protein